MKRIALLVVLLAAGLTGVARSAHAAVPCRDKVYNDWYADGKIATSYPIACYRDALKHVPADARVYSSLSDDIQTALQDALARGHGKREPAAAGKGLVSLGKGAVAGKSATLRGVKPEPPARTSSPNPSTVAVGQTSGGGGIPTPILVLGAVAILLAAAGAAGAGTKYFRDRR